MSLKVPDACTLPTVDQPLRLAEFDELFATAVRAVDSVTARHLRLELVGPDGLEARVRDLTARETECCSFFTFQITPSGTAEGESLTLDVEVPPAYEDVLSSLASRARTVSVGGAV